MPDPETNLPANKISKVKLDPNDDNSVYEIIPERLQKNGFEAALPTLAADTTLVTADGALKNPNALRLFVNTDTARFVSYDGSSQVDLLFKPSLTAGAFEITDGTTTKTIQLVGTFTDNNYYATSDFNSSNGTKIATGYSSGTASTTYDLYAPNATASQAGIVTTGDQTFAGTKTFSGHINSSSIYGTSNDGLYIQDSLGDDASLGLYESGAQLYGTTVLIAATGEGNLDLHADGNYNINLFNQNYSGSGKAYYKGAEIATVAGTRIEIVDLTTLNS